MTAIVTADQLVSGLATRINAGTDTSVSGPNKQLKDAMVAKNFFSGTGGGSSAGTEYATAEMNFHYSVPQTADGWGQLMTVTSSAQWNAYQGTSAMYTPNDTLYGYYTWDTVTVNSSSLGYWVSNRRFVFNRPCVASVSAGVGAVMVTSVPNTYRNLYVTLNIGNLVTNTAGRFEYSRASNDNSDPNLPIAAETLSVCRAFAANDFIEVRYVAHTLNGITDVENRAGVGRMARYGSITGNTSRMDIVAFN